MGEKEIRSVLRAVCEELDRRARKLIVPGLLGAGLALSAGCSDDSAPPPAKDATYESKVDTGITPDYMAPDARVDTGPVVEYMAPDARVDAGPQVDYMAPDMK